MAEDKQLKEGLGSFLNLGAKKTVKKQKVVPKEEAVAKISKKNPKTPIKEPLSDLIEKTIQEPNVAKKTLKSQKKDTTAKPIKNKNQKDSAQGSETLSKKTNIKTGPKSNKDPNKIYKQVAARIPETLKNRLKDALLIQLYGKMTQDEFIEQAILDLLKKKKIPENPREGL